MIIVIPTLSIVGINNYIVSSTKDYIQSDIQKEYDCILVLGAGVRNNAPTPMLRDRLDVAIALYEKGYAPKLLMSGDHGTETYDEVNIMKQYAIDAGVPSEDIFMDHAGFSTYESVYRARDIFLVETMIIVSQDYHLYRALYISKQLSVDSIGVSATLRDYVGQSSRDFREVLARIKDFTWCIFKPEPTYLGEPIPMSGSGDQTNDIEI